MIDYCHQSHDRQHRPFVFAVVAAIAAAILLSAPLPATAQEATPIYSEAPSPEVLGEILFGARYRSSTALPTDNRFGMLINFELNSTKMLPESLPLLNSVGEMLNIRNSDKEVLVIEGHADSRGSHAHNQGLSERRAAAIKGYLTEEFSVPAARLVTIGKGETDLHDTNDGKNPINRRVEFRAVRAIVIN